MDKETQRANLHKAIWSIVEDLRGSVDGWDFKSYVLGFLFYRFISENLCDFIRAREGVEYDTIDDAQAIGSKDALVKLKGFYIAPSELFSSIHARARQGGQALEGLNLLLHNALRNIEASCEGAESAEQFKGLFDELDMHSNKLGTSTLEKNKKLLQIMDSIAKLELGFQNNEMDAFGDAYEFLMSMYASNAGKSGGEFFTPQEVSELLAQITLHNNPTPNKVYDPCCGSGSALLQYQKLLSTEPHLGYFGQEVNLTSFNLCRMNMLLHNVAYHKIHIAHGDVLLHPSPKHKEQEPFDAIVSNPPYSTKWIGKDDPLLINDDRFSKAGILAPKSYADFAFILHMLSWLSQKGSAAIVCFPGIFYRGGAEKHIRTYLVENNFIDAIIALPENLFFGTNIATYILVLKKNKTTQDILFIDATKDFIKVGKDNKLSPANRAHILSLYTAPSTTPHISTLASIEAIRANDYNLSVSSYVEKEDTREKIDITLLNAQIKDIVARQSALRVELDSIISSLEGTQEEG